MDEDIKFLKETLRLAKNGLGWTNPNPMVGAVITKNGHIIGQGFHHKAGEAHAEIEALRSLKEAPSGATLYINLEPCTHLGKTPPCINKIIESKFKRIVYSTLDPNSKVINSRKTTLENSGMEVAVGTLNDEARKLNEAFFVYHEKKRPFVSIKFASSLDGKLASFTGDSKWITNEKARKYARNLRGKYQAILVGINTILKDNPHLGVRNKNKRDPIRIIIDPKLRIPINADVLRDSNVIIATIKTALKEKVKKLENKGITVLIFESNQIPIEELLSALWEKEIISILVEGGGETLGNFIDSKIVDKVYAFQAPILIGGKNAIGISGKGFQTVNNAMQLKNITFKKFDDNLLTIGYVV